MPFIKKWYCLAVALHSLVISCHFGSFYQVEVRVNLGKDFTRDTVELTGLTDPGSYICFSGVDWDLYRYGSNPFLTEEEVSLSFNIDLK